MTRRLITGAVALALAALGAMPASASTTMPFIGYVRDSLGLGSAPAGVAHIRGFGPASQSFVINSQTLVGACVLVVVDTTFVFEPGTVTVEETDLFCPQGHSASGPAAAGFGAPYTFEGTFRIASGTGAYAGADGGGTVDGVFAGNVLIGRYDGTLTLP